MAWSEAEYKPAGAQAEVILWGFLNCRLEIVLNLVKRAVIQDANPVAQMWGEEFPLLAWDLLVRYRDNSLLYLDSIKAALPPVEYARAYALASSAIHVYGKGLTKQDYLQFVLDLLRNNLTNATDEAIEINIADYLTLLHNNWTKQYKYCLKQGLIRINRLNIVKQNQPNESKVLACAPAASSRQGTKQIELINLNKPPYVGCRTEPYIIKRDARETIVVLPSLKILLDLTKVLG
jgi:hypothetical protein